MGRLVERGAVAQAGGSEHTERARDLGRLVGEDVTEHVLSHHDVEVGGAVDQLHRRVVHKQILDLDIGILGLADAMHDLAPHAACLKHVGLVDARHLLAALARCLERLARDALDLVLAILERVVSALPLGAVGAGTLLIVEALALAEVQTARQLAHDHKVDTGNDLGL